MKNNLKDEIMEAFAAPPPRNKQAFLKLMRPVKISTFYILRVQASYIRPVSWILSVMILPVVLLGLWLNPENVIHFTEVVTPFLALIGILETWRSYTYRVSELEQATRFSLRTVVYARMLLTSCSEAAMILLSSAFLAMYDRNSFPLIAARMMIPYLLTMSIGLQIERTAYGRKNPYCSVAVAVIISAILIGIDAVPFSLMEAIPEEIVIVVAAVLIALTIREAVRTIQYTEVYA